MTEVLWPPDLVPSSQSWTTIGNAATFNSPFSGTTRTYGRPGVRMGCTITLPPVKGEPRARMLAALRALKDRGNYIWVPDFSTTLETGLPVRGSFAANEVFANNNFASGATGWTAARCTLSAADRVLRLTNTKSSGAASFDVFQQNLSVTQYAPYALRSFIASVSRAGMSNGTSVDVSNYAVDRVGLVTQASVQLSATTSSVFPGTFDATGVVSLAGDYAELGWTSYARCALVDNGPNALTQSDDFTNAAWTKQACTIGSGGTAPDGTASANYIIEDTSTAAHYAFHSTFAVSASAADFCFCIALRGGGRNFGYIQLVESTGSTIASQFFDLNTGAVGASGSVGANWSNLRSSIVDAGNGWHTCCIVARKTNAATSVYVQVGAGTADGTSIYLGDGASGIYLWRATVGQSSAPVRLTQTTTTATTGTTQSSNRLYVKGLPASTQNLLKAGDMVQIGGQINQLSAPLDSNAAGLGVLICGNPWRSPADNAPIHVNTPMCKMQLASDTIDIETGPGQFSPLQLELVEVIE